MTDKKSFVVTISYVDTGDMLVMAFNDFSGPILDEKPQETPEEKKMDAKVLSVSARGSIKLRFSEKLSMRKSQSFEMTSSRTAIRR